MISESLSDGNTMKAIVIETFGNPDVLEYKDIPILEPNAGEVRIRVKAIGVNFGDTLIRAGDAPIPISLPMVPGSEVAGEIETLGPGVKNFKIGQRVAVPLFWKGKVEGGYAEMVIADTDILVPIPDAMNFEEAVAIQLQGFTALQLTEHVPPIGKQVLIHAAAGGVGSFLVQLAKLKGAAKVIATASMEEKLSLAKKLGADIAINYKESDWKDQVILATKGKGPDIIYDPVGGEIQKQSLEILATKGTYVLFGVSSEGKFKPLGAEQMVGLYSKNQFVTGFSGWPLFSEPGLVRNSFAELFRLVADGKLKIQIGKTYPLRDARSAHADLRSGNTVGKVVLIPE